MNFGGVFRQKLQDIFKYVCMYVCMYVFMYIKKTMFYHSRYTLSNAPGHVGRGHRKRLTT